MAKHFMLFFCLFLQLVRLGKVSSISTEAYWKLKLPKTPMPESIQNSLPPTDGIDNSRKGLKPTAKESLATINRYDGLLSYKESHSKSRSVNKQGLDLDSDNPKYLSYDNQGLATTNSYGGLLAYNKNGLHSNNQKYLSYNKQGLESTDGYRTGLLSYDKKSLDSKTQKYLSYNKQGLESTSGYRTGLLSYNKKSLVSENQKYLSYNKQGLDSTDGYRTGLLSYDKKSLDSENQKYLSYNKQGLESTDGYRTGLLSYDKKSLDSKNQKYLSYNNKQGLASTDGYRTGLLSYKSQSKESAEVDDHEANGATEDQVFFVEKDLHLGTKKTLHFQKSTRKGLFLPRKLSNQIPFSSKKVQETLQILSLDPKSKEAYVLSKRIELCEEPTIEGVEKKCVTSLESMVDYVISELGTNNVEALTTQVDKDYPKMEYTIKGVKKLAKDDRETVVCHKMGYPYAVFFCHRTTTIRSYVASLVGEDGTKIEAIAACHKESNDFLDNYAKNVLKIVPGSTRICHFPPAEDTIIWVPKY